MGVFFRMEPSSATMRALSASCALNVNGAARMMSSATIAVRQFGTLGLLYNGLRAQVEAGEARPDQQLDGTVGENMLHDLGVLVRSYWSSAVASWTSEPRRPPWAFRSSIWTCRLFLR